MLRARYFPSSLATLGLLIVMSGSPAMAQASPSLQDQVTSLQQLTQTLISVSQAGDQSTAAAVAKQRHDLLLAVAAVSPETALAFILPPHTVQQLPGSAAKYLETDAAETGTVLAVVEDYRDHHKLRFYLNTGREQLEMYLAGNLPPNLVTGAQVQATGKRIDNFLLVPAGALSAPAPASPTNGAGLTTSNTFGAQSTAVLLVNFFDNTSTPFTINDVRNEVFNDVSNFYLENSQNQTWLTGDVFGWFTMPTISVTTCPTIQTFSAAAQQAATNAGVDLSPYNRLVYIFPLNACGFRGQSTLGGNPSQAMINGEDDLQVIAHELGHGFGLLHSHSLICGNASIGTNCQTDEYGDEFDIMGGYTASHFNAFQKERLGWLNYGISLPITTVTSSGVYNISPYETGTGVKALKVLQSTEPTSGLNSWYYIEYRQLIGYDKSLSVYPTSTKGVLIRSGAEQAPGSSMLLNMNPPGSFDNAALGVGNTFVDGTAGLSITTKSVDATGATVDIEFGPYGCNAKSPTVTVSPPQSPPAASGSTQNFNLSVKNQDSGSCGSSTVIVLSSAPTVPGGWTETVATSLLTVAAGATASDMLSLTSPVGAPPGTYSFTVTVAKWPLFNFSSMTTAYYVVGTPSPDFAISVPATATLPVNGSTAVTVTSTLTNGFSAPVSFSVSGLPAGVSASFVPPSLPAPGSGTSTLTFTANGSTLTGTYPLSISGSSGGVVHAVALNLTVTAAPPPPDFAISAPATATLPVNGSTAVTVTSTVTNGFSAPVSFSLSGLPTGVSAGFAPSSLPAPGSGTSTLTFNANGTALAGTYPLTISGTSGAVLHPVALSLTVTAAPPPPPPPPPPATTYSMFSNTAVPASVGNAYWPLEMGMRFTSAVNGQVTGVRFYKTPSDHSSHVGSLWTSTGQLLAQVTFTNESASGWQQALFSSAVSITANTVYVVSYHSGGYYSYDDGYFNVPVSNPPLSAVAGSSGNGVYASGPVGTFPTNPFNSRNYWVDLVFTTSTATASLVSISVAPLNPTLSVSGKQQFTATGHYSDSSTQDLTQQVTWSSGTPAVASITSAGMATAVSAGTSLISAASGNITGSTILTVTSAPPPPPPPPQNSYSLFSSTAVPAVPYASAYWPVELGMMFTADRNGQITGVKFYKASNNTSSHVGSLWTSSGQLLAQATFTNESASGWQEVQFSTAVAITANTIYIVSYHTGGAYSYDDGYFNVPVSNPPLSAVAGSGNGVYGWGPVGTFPNIPANGRNYWVDVDFH
ncbi:MAG: DUF4082 domain-containing protein [Terriglobales bacterium]